MDNPNIATTIIVSIIVSTVGPAILVALNKIFSKKKDVSDFSKNLQEITENAVEETKRAREELSREQAESKTREERYKKLLEEVKGQNSALLQRVLDLENAQSGPFRITTEFFIRPSMAITAQSIEPINSPLSDRG